MNPIVVDMLCEKDPQEPSHPSWRRHVPLRKPWHATFKGPPSLPLYRFSRYLLLPPFWIHGGVCWGIRLPRALPPFHGNGSQLGADEAARRAKWLRHREAKPGTDGLLQRLLLTRPPWVLGAVYWWLVQLVACRVSSANSGTAACHRLFCRADSRRQKKEDDDVTSCKIRELFGRLLRGWLGTS